jgi:hypothetical protein
MDVDNELTTNASFSDVISIYRAVGQEECYSIIQTGLFSLSDASAGVKYFGLDFSETVDFSCRDINRHVFAVMEVIISKSVLHDIGDFTYVDTFIFKTGTVIIHEEDLDKFNCSVIKIIQKDWKL